VCVEDVDGDGYSGTCDNCVSTANPSQVGDPGSHTWQPARTVHTTTRVFLAWVVSHSCGFASCAYLRLSVPDCACGPLSTRLAATRLGTHVRQLGPLPSP
jgi:hypothetical protein